MIYMIIVFIIATIGIFYSFSILVKDNVNKTEI